MLLGANPGATSYTPELKLRGYLDLFYNMQKNRKYQSKCKIFFYILTIVLLQNVL